MRRLPAAVDHLPEQVRIAAAIEMLETRERHVLELVLLERLTTLETAGALRLTVRDVERLLANALERIAAEAGGVLGRRTQRRVA